MLAGFYFDALYRQEIISETDASMFSVRTGILCYIGHFSDRHRVERIIYPAILQRAVLEYRNIQKRYPDVGPV
jgi:hypothetical protein